MSDIEKAVEYAKAVIESERNPTWLNDANVVNMAQAVLDLSKEVERLRKALHDIESSVKHSCNIEYGNDTGMENCLKGGQMTRQVVFRAEMLTNAIKGIHTVWVWYSDGTTEGYEYFGSAPIFTRVIYP